MSDPIGEGPGAPRHTNRLGRETSPYLQQHAHNPVDWYPWGPEAFERARRENKPIFLSVGYSTCYWCHVMERQSFENAVVAGEMNRLFVNIKVDREERPDVDQLYMTAVQLITQHGGWPMSVWLTPELRPFYGGTYFPPDRFVGTLRALEDAYRNRRDEVDRSAEQIEQILIRLARPAAPDERLTVDAAFVDALVDRSVADYEPQFGGFGPAPRFPRQTLLELLLTYLAVPDGADRSAGAEARRAELARKLRHTLDAMADGGIRDHLGGGFHRYSTDARWLVPHFEIMLYDNALLGWIYAEASRQFGDARYAQVARGIFDFVLREMTGPDGAFYTAFDAEVDAREGLSYLWTAAEVESILGSADAAVFGRTYGLDRGPNFADPHHGNGQPDANILYLPQPLADVARELSTTTQELDRRLAPMRQRLYEARRRRRQPMLDTKVLTAWNALMIRALAHGGRVLQERRYIDAAARAAHVLLDRHRLPDGGLYRTSRDGAARHHGFLDDYAFLSQALLALHEATGDAAWKGQAADVAVAMLRKFADPEAGGFYFTDADAADLLVRQKTAQDSPLPSGNAAAVMALLGLDQVKGALGTLAAFARQMSEHGEAMSSMVQATLLYLRRGEPFNVSPAPGEADDDAARPRSPQQIAEGVVSAQAAWMSDAEFHLRLNILPGFHINAHSAGPGAGDAPLIATSLSIDQPGATIDYPPGEEQAFAFAQQPIRIYQGDVTFRVVLATPLKPASKVRLTLAYQACDSSACFPPVTRQFEMDVPSVH